MANDILRFQAGREAAIAKLPRDRRRGLDWLDGYDQVAIGDGVICARCGATRQTYADVCTAALDDACPGFQAIEKAWRIP